MSRISLAAFLGCKLYLAGMTMVVVFWLATCGNPAVADDPVYMFSYFKEQDGADGLHLAYSLDGLNYHAVNGDVGIMQDTQSTPFMRDPYVNLGPDGTFRLVYTTGWGGAYSQNGTYVVCSNIGYSSSTNLLSWSTPTYIDLPITNGQERWAPQIYYDTDTSQYVVYWSTRVGTSGQTDIYYSTTTDFSTVSTPAILYNYSSSVIDADIVKNGSNYVMFLVGILKAEGGTSVLGPYNTTNVPRITSSTFYSEGPSAIKIGSNWIVYNDHANNGDYAATMSTDNMATWSEYTDYVAFPRGARHGNVFTVSRAVAENLINSATNETTELEFVGDAGTSDFNTANNWFAGSVPGSDQTPVIQRGKTVNITSSPSGTLSGLKVGITSTGVLNISNNAVVSLSTTWPNGLILGGCIQGNGTVVQSGSSSVTVNGFTSIGKMGTGSYTLQSGSLTATGDFNIGDYRGAHGDFYVNNNSSLTVGTLYLGSGYNDSIATGNAVGALHQSGGTVNITGTGDSVIIGGRSSAYAVGTYELSGGAFNAGSSRVTVGNAGIGTLTVSGAAQANLSSGLLIASSGTGALHLDGGMISTSSVLGGGGSSAFHFNGGTLKASSSSTSFMSGLTTADVEAGGAVIDTNGYNVTVAQTLSSASSSGGLTKNGAGTITLSAPNTYSGPTTITQGTLTFGTISPPTAAHRWSFTNSSLADSIGSSNATIVEVGSNNVTFSSTQATIAGGTRSASDYIQLGSDLLPNTNTPITIELWATPISLQNWSRIFDFGVDSNENLFMSWTQGTNQNSDRVGWKDNGSETTSDNTNQPYTLNTEFHIVMELNPSGSSTVVTWYTAPSGNANLGGAKGSFTTDKTLAAFTDSADNLARSFYSGDSTANASYNEVRFWNAVLSSSILEILHDAGPDAVLGSLNLGSTGTLPSTTAVNITASGAALDLNNINQTIGSLSGVAGSSVLLGTATLTIGGDASTTFSGNISGAGGLTKNGIGTVTLSGTITYTGDTLINDGTLELLTGTTTLDDISGAGCLMVGSDTTTKQLTVSSINLGRLTIGPGSMLIINGSTEGLSDVQLSTTPVPEPSAWLLLLLAAAAYYLKKR